MKGHLAALWRGMQRYLKKQLDLIHIDLIKANIHLFNLKSRAESEAL